MKTIQIDEQMRQVGERAGQEAYERFKQEGNAQWHKEQGEQWQQRDIQASATETPRQVESGNN